MNLDLLKENRNHGDVLFPFGYYSMNYHDTGAIVDCHWHDELEFLLIDHGSAIFQVGDRQYELYKGQALFIHSGVIHSGYSTQNSWGFSAIVFHSDLLNSNPYDQIQGKYINSILENQNQFINVIKGEEPWEKEILKHLKKTMEIARKMEYTYELLIKSRLYHIFAILLQNENETDEPLYPYKANQLKAAIQHIQENYMQRIHIQELSRLVNMSEGHFCRYFKKIVMKSPIEYLNYYRIMKASLLLRNTNSKIIDIAMDVGFNNFSYFINRFKYFMKVTPARYRKAGW